MTLAKKELAAKLGVSTRTIDRWVRAGMPSEGVAGGRRFNLTAVKAWAVESSLGMTVRINSPAATGGEDGGQSDNTETYAAARTVRERYEALLSKAEYLKTIGNLVDAEAVRRAAFTTGRQAMQSIMSLRHRLDPLLSTEPDAHKRGLIWDKELRQICTEMAAGRENAINSVMTAH